MDVLRTAVAGILGLVALILAWTGRCLGLVLAVPLMVAAAVLLLPMVWLSATVLALLLYLLCRR